METIQQNNRVIGHQKSLLVCNQDIIQHFGLKASVFLQQVHYWISSKSPKIGVFHDGKRWIYNTVSEWIDQIKIFSERQFYRIIKKLKETGVLLIENLSAKKYNRTNYYTIDYERLKEVTGIHPGAAHKEFAQKTNEDLKNDSIQSEGLPVKMAVSSCQKDSFITEITPESNNLSLLEAKQEENLESKTVQKLSQQVLQVQGEILNLSLNEKKDKKEHFARDLLHIWNSVVEEEQKMILLTKQRSQFLISALKAKFNNSQEEWKIFCQKVASSRFLMGEITSFKASLDWILKFSNLQKVLEGNYKTGDRDVSYVSQKVVVAQNSTEDPEVVSVRELILKNLGSEIYSSWFQSVVLKKDQNNRLVIHSPNSFHARYIENNYGFDLGKIFPQNEILYA